MSKVKGSLVLQTAYKSLGKLDNGDIPLLAITIGADDKHISAFININPDDFPTEVKYIAKQLLDEIQSVVLPLYLLRKTVSATADEIAEKSSPDAETADEETKNSPLLDVWEALHTEFIDETSNVASLIGAMPNIPEDVLSDIKDNYASGIAKAHSAIHDLKQAILDSSV